MYHAFLRNILFYFLILFTIGIANIEGLMEVGIFSDFVISFVGFYTLLYGICWIHYGLLWRLYFEKGQYAKYGILFVILVLITSQVFNLGNPGDIKSWMANVFSSLVIIIFGLGISLIYKYVYIDRLKLRNDLINSQVEIAVLKNQMNPHFLFNALNNLYSLSLTEPQNISHHIEIIADMMRYQVEVSKKEQISLEEEIKFLQQYVSYEQLKIGKRGAINFEIRVDASPQISPMILFPLIENAVKYGSVVSQPCISISIILIGKQLSFYVENTYNVAFNTENNSTNIGIKNISRRLELLYPDQHKLIIEPYQDKYIVKLSLRLI
jgi:two-component system LytT family sensor kinase